MYSRPVFHGFTHHPEFLAAVCESPFEDTPRLVYADYLEENPRHEGDVLLARFLRAQVLLHAPGAVVCGHEPCYHPLNTLTEKTFAPGCVTCEAYKALKDFYHTPVMAGVQTTWDEAIRKAPWGAVPRRDVHRGFVRGVRVSGWFPFAESCVALFRGHPVTRVRLAQYAPRRDYAPVRLYTTAGGYRTDHPASFLWVYDRPADTPNGPPRRMVSPHVVPFLSRHARMWTSAEKEFPVFESRGEAEEALSRALVDFGRASAGQGRLEWPLIDSPLE